MSARRLHHGPVRRKHPFAPECGATAETGTPARGNHPSVAPSRPLRLLLFLIHDLNASTVRQTAPRARPRRRGADLPLQREVEVWDLELHVPIGVRARVSNPPRRQMHLFHDNVRVGAVGERILLREVRVEGDAGVLSPSRGIVRMSGAQRARRRRHTHLEVLVHAGQPPVAAMRHGSASWQGE